MTRTGPPSSFRLSLVMCPLFILHPSSFVLSSDWTKTVVGHDAWQAVRELWHGMLIGDPPLEARWRRWWPRVAEHLAAERVRRARQGLPAELLTEYDWLVLQRVLTAAARTADQARAPRRRPAWIRDDEAPRHIRSKLVVLTVKALWHLRGQSVEASVREQCRDRLITAFKEDRFYDPSITDEDDLLTEARRLLALDGASDGRAGRRAVETVHQARARRSLAERQERIKRDVEGLRPEQRHARIASLLVETTLSTDRTADALGTLRDELRRPRLVERLLAMCAAVQPHFERRALWTGLKTLVDHSDLRALRPLLDDPRVVIRSRSVIRNKRAETEGLLYFPVRDAVRQCLETLDLTADVTVEMPLDSPEAERHLERLAKRDRQALGRLRPALEAIPLARYRDLLRPRP